MRTRPRIWISLAACAVAMMVSACAAERESTLMRSSRARAIGRMRTERDQQLRDLAVWEATRDQAERETASARFESVQVSARLRSARSELQRELARLEKVEKALATARQRGVELEKQLQPLRELEQVVVEREGRIKSLRDRSVKLASEVAKATESSAKQEALLRPKLDKLQKRLADLKAAGVAIADAEAKVAAAAKVLAPLAPKQPAKKD